MTMMNDLPAIADTPASQEPILCLLCPEHDPFASEDSLRMHGVRSEVHKARVMAAGIDDADDPDSTRSLPRDVVLGPDGKPSPASLAASLARIDIGDRGDGPGVDDTFDAILKRQKEHGMFDPLTKKRVVVLGGRIRVRQTVGADAERGQAERVDYYDPSYGWIRDGFINERGRVYITTEGPLVL